MGYRPIPIITAQWHLPIQGAGKHNNICCFCSNFLMCTVPSHLHSADCVQYFTFFGPDTKLAKSAQKAMCSCERQASMTAAKISIQNVVTMTNVMWQTLCGYFELENSGVAIETDSYKSDDTDTRVDALVRMFISSGLLIQLAWLQSPISEEYVTVSSQQITPHCTYKKSSCSRKL